MKIATLLHVCLAHTLLFRTVYSDNLDDAYDFDEEGVVTTCDAIPDRATLEGGIVTLLAPILCTTPKVLEIAADTIIRSHAAIRTSDLEFYVHRGARLTFIAPFVAIDRKAMKQTDPVLRVEGSVSFEVYAWVLGHLDGASTDGHHLVSCKHGSLESNGLIRYTSRAIIVADPFGANKVDGHPLILHSEDQMAFADVHEGINPGSSSNTDAEISIHYLTTTPNIEWSPGTAITNRGNHQSVEKDFNGDNYDASPEFVNAWTSKKKREQRRGGKEPLAPEPSIEASQKSLRVGQQLIRSLTSPATNAKLYFSGETGSLKFSKEIRNAPRDDEGRPIVPDLRQSTTLIQADPKKMKEVVERRESIIKESKKEETKRRLTGTFDDKKPQRQRGAPRGGPKNYDVAVDDENEKKSKFALFLEYMPYGKNGYRERRAREYAADHLGEAYVTIDNKGTLEGTVEGTVVMRHQAPSFFLYRKKDESYELRATEIGLVVMRGGRPVWRVDAPDMWLRL